MTTVRLTVLDLLLGEPYTVVDRWLVGDHKRAVVISRGGVLLEGSYWVTGGGNYEDEPSIDDEWTVVEPVEVTIPATTKTVYEPVLS